LRNSWFAGATATVNAQEHGLSCRYQAWPVQARPARTAAPDSSTATPEQQTMQDLEALDREAEQIVKDIGIPPCPAILTNLLREMRQDEPDMQKIGRLIGSDVGLAATMLKTVNSPFYGLTNKASSVTQALVVLGLRNVGQLITGLLLKQAFPVSQNEHMEEFWESSSRTALFTAHLAAKIKGVGRDDAYTFALFRDCAVPLLMKKFPDYYETYSAAGYAPQKSFTEVENEICATNHARVGCQLARSWRLPDQTCLAILRHHDHAVLANHAAPIAPGAAKLIALALLAEQLYNKVEVGRKCPEWGKGGATALELLGMTEGELEAVEQEIGTLS
jgi:HD-like signal output (HDOD) protein